MTSAWIHSGKRLLAAALLALCTLPACAHKASDAYLQLHADAASTRLRIDIALRDLDVALDLDADGDGRLTWREVRTAWPAIEDYVRNRVGIAGCAWTSSARTLERRSDGVYAALSLTSDCRLDAPPVLRYTLMREVDPTHRGIARIDIGGAASVLRVLDPMHPATLAAVGKGEVAAARPRNDSASDSETSGEEGKAGEVAAPVPARDADAPPFAQFLREGVQHILTGYDHVLFLLCLLLPAVMRRTATGWQPVERLREAWWPVAGIVTAFTAAHSITLGLAASRLVTLPSSVIEPAIAATIVLAAIDNVWPLFGERRALLTFAFGLVHGFGFAGVLAELNLPAWQFGWALLQFNLGLEVGQLMIVTLAVGLLYALRRTPRYPAWVLRGGSCTAMLIGTLWFIDRSLNLHALPL
jgi:hypothetical protein